MSIEDCSLKVPATEYAKAQQRIAELEANDARWEADMGEQMTICVKQAACIAELELENQDLLLDLGVRDKRIAELESKLGRSEEWVERLKDDETTKKLLDEIANKNDRIAELEEFIRSIAINSPMGPLTVEASKLLEKG